MKYVSHIFTYIVKCIENHHKLLRLSFKQHETTQTHSERNAGSRGGKSSEAKVSHLADAVGWCQHFLGKEAAPLHALHHPDNFQNELDLWHEHQIAQDPFYMIPVPQNRWKGIVCT